MIKPLFKPDPVELHAAALMCGVKPASQSKGVRMAETVRQIRKAVADDLNLLFVCSPKYEALLYTMQELMPTFVEKQVTYKWGPQGKCGCGCRCECPDFNPGKVLHAAWLEQINSGYTTSGYDEWISFALRPNR